MKKGIIKINISDLLAYDQKVKDKQITIDNIMIDREREGKDLERMYLEVAEMSKIYEQDKTVIKQLQERRHAESIYEYVKKYDDGFSKVRVPEHAFNDAFTKFLSDIIADQKQKDDNDDLPF